MSLCSLSESQRWAHAWRFLFQVLSASSGKGFLHLLQLLCWLESVCFGEEARSLPQAPHSWGCTSVTLWSWIITCHLFTLPPSLLGKHLLPSPKASSFAQLFKSSAFFISTQVWMIKQQLGLLAFKTYLGFSWAQWFTSVTPRSRKMRREDLKFEASLG